MPKDPQPCQWCSKEFVPDRSTARFCRKACADAAREAAVTRVCEWATCDRKARYGLPMCGTHYKRMRDGRDMGAPMRGERRCTVAGCDSKHVARGYCATHYSRWKKYGEPGSSALRRASNGEGWTNADGYRARRTGGRGAPAILEHREAMALLLGRPLLRTETVHHVNGVRHDNTTAGPLGPDFRSGNLELWTKSHPSGQRVADKVAWAIELLAQYAPERLTPA